MGVYSQWNRHRRISRVAWVTGPEAVLRYDVASAWKDALPGASRYSLYSGSHRLWDFLLAVPSEPRLVLVWDAERLSQLHHVPLLLEPEFDGAYVVFISAADDFLRVSADSDARPVLAPPFAALRDSRHGQLIRCCMPADPESRAEIVASWWPPAGRNLGAALLDRCDGDLGAARQAAVKACLAGLPPSPENLELVCLPGRGAFAEQLIAGNVKEAMAAATAVRPDDAGELLGLLSHRLSTLSLLGEALRRGERAQDTAIKLKLDPYSVRLLRPHAAGYTPGKVKRCREVLAIAEEAWRARARTGILEAVAALW